MVHELAHVMEWPSPYQPRVGVAQGTLNREARDMGREVACEPPQEGVILPFRKHAIRFIRIVLHLRHRAELAGCYIAASTLCAGYSHGLSHADGYRFVLGDEPERMVDSTFRDICRIDPPVEFERLWHSDVDRWLDSLPQTDNEQA